MQIKYYETAWRDISNSPGWFGKICLLSLVNFIPIFGQIVTFGYLYGWAREIAWGVHAPMPSKLINNDDGRFWRRGWFVLVLVFVFALVPGIISSIGQIMQGMGYSAVRIGEHGVGGSVLGTIGLLIYFVGLIGTFLTSILAWIGSMRVAIYDRLSAGFQLGKIWKMFRHDTGGIMRIFGMELLVGLIMSVVLSIVVTTLMMIVMFAGVAGLMSSGYSTESFQYMTDTQMAQLGIQFLLSAGVVGIVCFFAMIFVSFMATVFIDMLVIRAVGYWVWQFDVPRWRGQDDPMPFEMGMGAGVPPMYAAPQHVPGPGAGPMAGGAAGPMAGGAAGPMAGGAAGPMAGGAAGPGVSTAPMTGSMPEPGVTGAPNAQVAVPSAMPTEPAVVVPAASPTEPTAVASAAATAVAAVPIAAAVETASAIETESVVSQGDAPDAAGIEPVVDAPTPDAPFAAPSQPAAQVGDFGYAHGPQADPQVARTVAEAPVITAQLVDSQAASTPADGLGSTQAATSFAEEPFQPQSDQPAADAGAVSPESGQANPSND